MNKNQKEDQSNEKIDSQDIASMNSNFDSFKTSQAKSDKTINDSLDSDSSDISTIDKNQQDDQSNEKIDSQDIASINTSLDKESSDISTIDSNYGDLKSSFDDFEKQEEKDFGTVTLDENDLLKF